MRKTITAVILSIALAAIIYFPFVTIEPTPFSQSDSITDTELLASDPPVGGQ